jgi:predicted Rossmann fold flavoprotein
METGCRAEIVIVEKTAQFLSKVRISGGGRCNVTHACFNEREFATRYPRGEQELIGALKRFQAADTVAWFAERGVTLKTESDGRMFPTTDSSETVINCLLHEARKAGVRLMTHAGVEQARTEVTEAHPGSHQPPERSFHLTLSTGETLVCDRLLLATGGCRTPALGQLAVSLGHTLVPPVPSLFTFHIEVPWLRDLAGVSVPSVDVSIPGTRLEASGPLLVTHWGLSGPVILRLSAWGARAFHEKSYRFSLQVNWLPDWPAERLGREFDLRRKTQPARLIVNSPITPLPARLWEQLVSASGIERSLRWSALSRPAQHRLIQQLLRSEFPVTGKSLNKEEFVTCGGVRLNEVNFKTMESRVCPGLFFAGELLDIDGITGGFNFQAAWTTGWIAGRAMASA